MADVLVVVLCFGLFAAMTATAAFAGHPASQPADLADLPATQPDARLTLDLLLDAVGQVESGGNPHAVGDGGRSLGPYQITSAYWADAWKSLDATPD